MNSELERRLSAVDADMLTPLVRRILRSDTIVVSEHHYHPLRGGAGGPFEGVAGVYRFAGEGRDQGKGVSWSLVLKVIRLYPRSGAPSDARYWQREPLAYRSGLLDNLPGDLAAPRCIGVIKQPDDEYWIWLEEIVGVEGTLWPLERYDLAARHLGQFNGAYLMEKSLPTYPWLSRKWLRARVMEAASAMGELPSVIEQPEASTWFPADLADEMQELWAERQALLEAFERLPQTLCHRDASCRNLFARNDPEGNDQTVAIDWPLVGIGVLGEDIASLAGGSLAWFRVSVTKAQELDQIVFQAYLTGLRDAGWRGDPQAIRFGYAAAIALRYGTQTVGLLTNAIRLPNVGAILEEASGRSIGEIRDDYPKLVRFTLDMGEEARELLDTLL